MKLFLDSAVLSEVQDLKNFIDGVTTNPSLVAKTKRLTRT